MSERLKTITVIVDRRVLAELLGMAAEGFDTVDACEYSNHVYRLQREVESGDRCELYARDWPAQTYEGLMNPADYFAHGETHAEASAKWNADFRKALGLGPGGSGRG